MSQVRILIVDDIAETRANVKRLIELDERTAVAGEAADGAEALAMARQLRPDVVLMDINMPVMDGITATERLGTMLPDAAVVMMSVQGETEYMRKAMLAGARDYLVKPFSNDDLIDAVLRVSQGRGRSRSPSSEPAANGTLITVFSAKGGVGKTTLATNLAVLLAAEGQRRSVIVDLDLQFGDVPVLLDLVPHATIADLVRENRDLGSLEIEPYLVGHASGARMLSAPVRPEEGDLIEGKHVTDVLGALRRRADFIIVDTPPAFTDPVLAALDASDQVWLVATLDVPTIKNLRLCIDVLTSLQYDFKKVRVLLNRASNDVGLDPSAVEKSLDFPVTGLVPSDGVRVVSSVNRGVPIVLDEPESPVPVALRKIAREFMPVEGGAAPQAKPHRWLGMLRRQGSAAAMR
ncbi:MAG TPA: response regulator [Limnochordia bacterium]|nr:response regulator [Limnochordia bacterium]